MNSIIQQIVIEMAEKIEEKSILKRGLVDLDALCADLLEDCKEAAGKIVISMIDEMNEEIRKDKVGRREQGLVLQQRDRPRSFLTRLGQLDWDRDYYYDKKTDSYCYPLDAVLGVEKYERVGDAVSAELIDQASEMSYARSSDVVTGGKVSRQTVRNKILKVDVPEIEPEKEKRVVRELHLYADEDHVSMQRPNKERGKRDQIVPLVTVTEGTERLGGRRNRTIHPVHFVDEEFNARRLWENVAGYILTTYDMDVLEKVYLHSDGGNWIVKGMEWFPQVQHVFDEYHFNTRLREISAMFPGHQVRQTLQRYLKKDDRDSADRYLGQLISGSGERKEEKVRGFAGYLMRFWDAIRTRLTEELPGSCTEGQVSHILSVRFSRAPMGWSKAGLGKLTRIRVSIKNGRKITKEDLKDHERARTNREYGEQALEKYLGEASDWSLFEKEGSIFDPASGTQIAIRKMGQIQNMLS